MTTDVRLPFTVLLPDSADDPIEVHDHSVGLRMAVITPRSLATLSSEWDASGVYILLDRHQADETYGVYVGKAPAGIRARLHTHRRTRAWARALLIQRGGYIGLNSAHAGWLEGDLYDLFDASELGQLHNSVQPGDGTVAPYDIRILESFRDPIIRILNLLGYSTASPDADDAPALVGDAKGKRKYTNYGVTVQELIEAGALPGDVPLLSIRRGWPATGHLNADGTITHDGITHPTPSSAGAAVRGGVATNGWDLWAVVLDGQTTRLSTFRKRYLEQ